MHGGVLAAAVRVVVVAADGVLARAALAVHLGVVYLEMNGLKEGKKCERVAVAGNCGFLLVWGSKGWENRTDDVCS